ncbi:MAG TPA: HAD-IIB family hydrolase [Casimicrobiaceae bacterium]|nr:HAD-IIB family hydrolase [Casimicrobiaceae bacterium]
MRPLAAMPLAARAAMRGVLADIDDTLSTRGRITAQAYTAMEHLRAAGLLVIPITGRPAGWCDHIARMWPVDAVVGENGALYMLYDQGAGRLRKRYVATEAERSANRLRLAEVAETILREVPGAGLASDQPYRESDLAIDFCEDVPRLTDEAIDRIMSLMRAAGMTAKMSSIHVNGWFGAYDKLAMTRILLGDEFGIDMDAERDHFIFVGDSPNDAPMFKHFPYSVGVANVRAFTGRIATPPAYVTECDSGAGFAELAAHLLAAR